MNGVAATCFFLAVAHFTVPQGKPWRWLDRLSSWREFAAGASETLVGDIGRFSPDVALPTAGAPLALTGAIKY